MQCVPHTIPGHQQRAGNLLHEQCVGMRRGSENLHTPGGQVDHQHRVIRDQASPRPDFRRKEVGACNTAPVRFQKRLTRRGALRDRRQARRLQDPPNGRATHSMSNVVERALDPRSRRILRRHSHDELTYREQHTAPSGFPGVRPHSDDKLAMPPQQGVWCRDRGDLPQGRTADSVRSGRQAAAIVVGETQPTPTELTPQEPVLFD